MAIEHDFAALNRASTERMRALAARLSDEAMQTRVGEHWTVAIVLAHLAWWDRRVMYVYNPRWVVRAMHRGQHLDEADAALHARGID